MSDELGRRQFMRKAAVAGAIVWTVPTIVSLEPAGAAERHSAAPRPPKQPQTETNTFDTGGAALEMGPALPKGLPASLPFTGDNERTGAIIGTGIAAAGAALIVKGGPTRKPLDT